MVLMLIFSMGHPGFFEGHTVHLEKMISGKIQV